MSSWLVAAVKLASSQVTSSGSSQSTKLKPARKDKKIEKCESHHFSIRARKDMSKKKCSSVNNAISHRHADLQVSREGGLVGGQYARIRVGVKMLGFVFCCGRYFRSWLIANNDVLMTCRNQCCHG